MASHTSFSLHLPRCEGCWTLGSSGSCWSPGLLECSMELGVLGWYMVWRLLPPVSFAFLCPVPLALLGLLHVLSAHLLGSLHLTHVLHTLIQAFPRQWMSAEGTGHVQVPDAGGLCHSCGLVLGKPVPSLVGALLFFLSFPSCLWTGSGILYSFLWIF